MNKCLISMAVYDTDQNKRTEYTIKTFNSLMKTTNPETTRIFIIDNDSCKKTKEFLAKIKKPNVTVITNKSNIGTSEAINLGLKHRQPGEYCVKIDNDVLIYDDKWVEKMMYCFSKEPNLGVLGLKRVDLPNKPKSEVYPTLLRFVNQELGEEWHVIEECGDIIGTCLMISPLLLDKIGYLFQPSCYGFDDNLLCVRSMMAGFYNAFYPSIKIDHIDDGSNPYTEWKKKNAGLYFKKFEEIKQKIIEGINPMMDHEISYYYNPYV